MNAKAARILRKAGLSVSRYRHSTPARRALMLATRNVDLLVDGGANVGQYATEIRSHGYRGDIVSFEPLTTVLPHLQAVAAADGRWRVVAAALGDRTGESTINESSSNRFSSLLPNAPLQDKVSPQARVTRTETIDVVRLDDTIETEDRTVAVKLDVQGYEREALLGAAATVAAAVYLELEISLVPLYAGQASAPELFSLCFDHGFDLAWADPFYLDATGRALQLNAIFVRP